MNVSLVTQPGIVRVAVFAVIGGLLLATTTMVLMHDSAGASGVRLLEVALALLSGIVIALLGVLIFSEMAARSAISDELRKYRFSPRPMARCDLRGRILWANRAMCDLGRGPAGDSDCDATRDRGSWILDKLRQSGTVAAADVYRVSRLAMSAGFAFAEIENRETAEIAYLVAWAAEPDGLIWSIVPADQMTEILAPGLPMAYAVAPMAHIRVNGANVVSANRRFRQVFGDDPGVIVEALTFDDELRGGRFLLPMIGKGDGLVRVFVADAGMADEAMRDVFLFPLRRGEDAEAPMTGLDEVPVPLVQLDLSGRVLWRNDRANEMLMQRLRPGIRIEAVLESLGQPIPAMVELVGSGAKAAWSEMARFAGSGHDVFIEIELTRVEVDGQPTLFAVLTDANELRQLEDKFAQSQKMEAVGKLAGGVAHDFNNVLTAISGHCDLMLLGKEVTDPDYSDLVQVRQNANRAAGLVRQLLAFSRKQALNPTTLNIHDVVSDTLYLLDRLIGEKISLVLDHGRDLLPVRADRQQLEQALMNLVVNARDAMPSGGCVTISTANRFFSTDRTISGVEITAGSYVEITVRDEGSGIDPAIIGKVFDPFFTTKAQGEGTGLGLSTVYGIVKQSGGFIVAENLDSGGAVFRILLPKASAAREAELQAPAEQGAKPGSDQTGQAAVLLVEDETPVRAFASRALALRGYEVTAAASAEEAMAILSDPGFATDLLISDVVMPGMDGPSFAREALKLRPGMKVIFVSGYAEESFRKSMLNEEFDFLPKPFSLAQLTSKVKEVLEAA